MGFEDAFANINKPKQQKFDKNQKSNPVQKIEPKKEKSKKEKPKRANLGWLFFKDYFSDRDFDYKNLSSEQNKKVINNKVENIINQGFSRANQQMLGNTSFELKTTYPGLLIGSGNAHKLPDTEGQAILGFHFDYTSGLPEIPGSSIKGVLRSVFEYEEYILSLLDDEDKGQNIKELESAIFDNGDIFFDAVIVQSAKENKILGDDFLTPHKEAIKNPIPLRFLKVLPEVTFRFGFELKDDVLNKTKKERLFKSIILDLGLGAKTNVGYGKFEELN
ncbi:type III-B CRISPR module RAMP protein Cmr6 [bacterium]|nr:type III-B CRISPR module RAMP protein Cmr6 [bacterium]